VRRFSLKIGLSSHPFLFSIVLLARIAISLPLSCLELKRNQASQSVSQFVCKFRRNMARTNDDAGNCEWTLVEVGNVTMSFHNSRGRERIEWWETMPPFGMNDSEPSLDKMIHHTDGTIPSHLLMKWNSNSWLLCIYFLWTRGWGEKVTLQSSSRLQFSQVCYAFFLHPGGKGSHLVSPLLASSSPSSEENSTTKGHRNQINLLT